MQLFNTLSGRKEPFTPAQPDRVSLYVCGPTVYSYAHIGNARPAVVFDVLARVLEHRYGRVDYVRNITDIDDKINAAAKARGVPIAEITEHYARIYREDMGALGVRAPTFEPRVTDYVARIIDMVTRLVGSGHAYEAAGHVLFAVETFGAYGKLSRRDPKELLAGARVEVAPYKKAPGDFVLWKPSAADLPGWDSPWGRGRPGWHIECSAMAEALLGETVDIHGGGHDLIFPHHENEIAQSECAHGGAPLARYWLHNGFLNLTDADGVDVKMSKSLGNVQLVHDLVRQFPPEALRLALMTAHYRQPLDWNTPAIEAARAKLDRLYGALRALEAVEPDPAVGAPESFVAALEDDLNTPRALAELFELARQAHRRAEAGDLPGGGAGEARRLKAELLAAGRLMGLLESSPAAWFQGQGARPEGADGPDQATIEGLLAARVQARAEKRWADSDRLRDELKSLGVLVEDSRDGQRWRRAAATEAAP